MGLFDRNYMRGGGGPAFFERRDGMGMIWKLIAVNVLIYFLVLMNRRWGYELVLTAEAFRAGQVYRVVTAAFLHLEFFHILFNMWGLYLFGSLIAPYLSGMRVLALYLVGGIAGNLLFLLFNWDNPFFLLGASGAVYAVMMAAAMLEPNRKFVLIFLPFWPLKTSTMVICFTVIELFSEAGNYGGGVAHLAHLGGFIGGYLVMKLFRNVPVAWDPLRMLSAGGRARNRQSNESDSGRYRYRASEYRASDWSRPEANFTVGSDAPVSQAELDRLLDKISVEGINSLSEDELARLRRAREQMKRQGR